MNGLLLSGGLSDDEVFGVVLVILVALLGILIIVAARRSSAARKKESPTPPRSGSGSGAGTSVPVKTPEPKKETPKLGGDLAKKFKPDPVPHGYLSPGGGTPRPVDNMSLDEKIAKQNGQWVCRFCECMNDDALTVCQACGSPRSH